MISELQIPTAYVRYGFSTYLIVIAALMSLLSMGLALWRIVSMEIFVNDKHNLFMFSIFAGFIIILDQ
jgi:hypothetical protein